MIEEVIFEEDEEEEMSEESESDPDDPTHTPLEMVSHLTVKILEKCQKKSQNGKNNHNSWKIPRSTNLVIVEDENPKINKVEIKYT